MFTYWEQFIFSFFLLTRPYSWMFPVATNSTCFFVVCWTKTMNTEGLGFFKGRVVLSHQLSLSTHSICWPFLRNCPLSNYVKMEAPQVITRLTIKSCAHLIMWNFHIIQEEILQITCQELGNTTPLTGFLFKYHYVMLVFIRTPCLIKLLNLIP